MDLNLQECSHMYMLAPYLSFRWQDVNTLTCSKKNIGIVTKGSEKTIHLYLVRIANISFCLRQISQYVVVWLLLWQ